MTKSRRRLLFVILFCTLGELAKAQETEPIALDEREIDDGLFLFRPDAPIGNPATLAMITATEILLVDASIEGAWPAILKSIRQKSDAPIKYVVTSHHHGDHTQGLEYLPTTTVAITPDVQRERLKVTSLTFDGSPPLKSEALPQLTFQKAVTLHLGKDKVHILTPPTQSSHTDGDAFVYFEDRDILYVGDHYVMDKFPLIDFEGGGSLKGYMANLHWVLENFPAGTRIVAGHNTFKPQPIVIASHEKYTTWVDQIDQAVDILQSYASEGLSTDDVIARGLGAEYKSFGKRPRYASEEKWIRMIYPHVQTE